MPLYTKCGCCGALTPLVAAVELAALREALEAALALRLDPVRTLRYLDLFAAPGRELSESKAAKVLADLLERVRSGQVKQQGMAYAAPQASWEIGMQTVLDNDSKTLPLKSNNYLAAVVAGQAAKAAGQAEAKREERLRNGQDRPRPAVERDDQGPKRAVDYVPTAPPPRAINREAGLTAASNLKKVLRTGAKGNDEG
jgi:hypothetical protein